MRLTEDVYLVGGSPSNGFGLSGGMDSHIYLVDGGAALALVDCGMASGDSIDRIVDTIRRDGLDPERLEKVFVTHYHVDHMGGLAAWQERFGVSAAIGADVAEAVSAADVHATGFALAREAGVYPSDYALHPAKVDDPLHDGDVRAVGDVSIEFIATPGHCRGHGTYRVRGRRRSHLFTGDCVFHRGEILLLNTADCDLRAYRESLLRLDDLDFDAFLPGHGALCLTGGKQHVATAAAAFRTLSLPKSFL